MRIQEEIVIKISTLPLWGRIDELQEKLHTGLLSCQMVLIKYQNIIFCVVKEKLIIKRLQSSRKLDSYIKQLKRINLPAFPNDVDGCDGALTTITYKEGFIEFSFQWWSEPPDSWKLLDQLTIEIIAFLEM